MAADILIGTGYIGAMLQKQRRFDLCFKSRDLSAVSKHRFGTVYCAAMPGTKWQANLNTAADMRALLNLMESLDTIKAERFVLISTADVFPQPAVDVNERAKPSPNTPYGKHRRVLETFIKTMFSRYLIVRLPGVVGPGMKKGPLFDLRHDNFVDLLCPHSQYQWYPGMRLVEDCEKAMSREIEVAHFVTPPVSTLEIALRFRPNLVPKMMYELEPLKYDLRTIHTSSAYWRETPWAELKEFFE